MTTHIKRRWGILSLAVIMFLVTLIVTNINGAKTSVYYFVWMMVGYYAYKDRIVDMKLLMKIVIFINIAVASAVIFLADQKFLAFLGSDSKSDFLISVFIMLIPKAFIFFYCENKLKIETSKIEGTDSTKDFYKAAYQELYSDERDTSLWIESLSISKGDRAEAEAHYLKHRASQLNENQKILESYKEKDSSRSLLEVIDDNFIPFIFWGAIFGLAIFLFMVATKVSQKIESETAVRSIDPIQKNVNTANQKLEGTQKFSECEHISDGENIKFNTDGKVEMSVVRKIANYDFIDSTTLDKVTDSFQECGVLDANTIYCNKDDASEANIKHEISVDLLQKIMTVKKLKMKDYGFDVASLTKCSLN